MAKQQPNKKEHPSKKKSSPASKAPDFLIVGIGASAGGLEAFKEFFNNMPPDTGMAFIIVQHLDPTHKSFLSDLLRHYTKMEVLEIIDNTKVLPNTIYTIPPNKELGIFNKTLQLMEPVELRGHRRTIDYFMRSLADDQKDKAVGIILSGTGIEGAIGLKAIKGAGGLTMVQDPNTAKYDGMPRSAIAASSADYILAADKMPSKLVNYMKKRRIKPISVQTEIVFQQNILEKIFLLLRDQTGNNFSYYKTSTIIRRINKRMAINQITKLETYLKYLQKTPDEINLLFNELLIGVTNFFRNKAAFKALEDKIIAEIVKNKSAKDVIRVWVPGCSNGEEAYSIAMLFDEALRKQRKKIPFQLFASDIDERAIDTARMGIYPNSIAVDVGETRLQRYFIVENHVCKVKKELRDKVIFAVQNLIIDPPFSKLDLISCRNLLIYLNTDAQKRVFPIFHYSLNPEGKLFLGTSETISQFSNLFTPLDRKNKLFIRKSGIVKQRPMLDFARTDIDYDSLQKIKMGVPQRHPTLKLSDLTEKILLRNYAPSCVVINEKNVALYFYGNTGKYLQPSTGEANLNILEMARTGLKSDLRAAISIVRKNKTDVVRAGVRVKSNGGHSTITLKVKPVNQSETEEQLIMILFEDFAPTIQTPIPVKPASEGEQAHIVELEHELASTKEYLRTTIEELEISNEELKSANEELQSANEELQSTNEELETSKEELQSVNEEMITVNTELQNKIFELAHAHDDMSNLLASTEIGTVFLGSDLEIRRFTPSITKVINLIQTDIGRSIRDLATNLRYDDLAIDAQKVLDDLSVIRRVVQAKDGQWFHMQITPYRTTDNVIDGVVMTFVDTTEEKNIEEKLKKVNEHFNLALEALPAVAFTCKANDNLEFIFVGASAKKILGFSPENFMDNPGFWIKRIHPQDRKNVIATLAKLSSEKFIDYEYRWKCADGIYKRFISHVRYVKSPKKEEEDYLVGIWQYISANPKTKDS